jgi:hypothetical protein
MIKKLFTAVIYEYLEARVFVPGKPFQSILMFRVRPGVEEWSTSGASFY